MGVSVIPIKVPALQAGQEYIQDKRDRFNVSLPVDKVRGLVWCDQAATLYIEESDDGSVWAAIKTVAVTKKTTADTGRVTLSKRYYRFRLTNGATDQGSMVLYQQIVGLGSYLSTDEQASVVVLDHGILGANPVPVQLKGSLVEYAWLADDVEKPTPTEDFAWGIEFDKLTGDVTVFGWDGSAWVEVA